MNFAGQHNIGALIDADNGMVEQAVTAGGAGDNTQVNGLIIDRLKSGRKFAHSAALVITYEAVLAATKTLSLAADIQHGANSALSDAAVLSTGIAATVVATGPTGGGTVRGAKIVAVDLGSAKQYFRARITPDLSATATDTAKVSATWILGGLESRPA